MWITDGTALGTTELTVTGASSSGLSPSDFASLGSKLAFSGADSSGHNNLWVTDGTAGGTTEITVTGAATAGLDPHDLFAYNGKVLFGGTDADGNNALWVTDGTDSGTYEINAANVGPSGISPSYFAEVNGRLVFYGIDADSESGLWSTDGTANGTVELSVSGTAASFDPNFLFTTSIQSPFFINDAATASVSGTLGAGAIVNFVLSVSTPVTVDTTNGSPALTLDDGATATYVGQDSDGNLLFTYTVAAGENTAGLQVTGLSLNGATISNELGAIEADALPSLPGSNTGLVVNTMPANATPPSDTLLPIYRFFDQANGTHLFTSSDAERDQVLSTRPDLTYEGQPFGAVAASSADAHLAPVYRFFDTVNGDHFFTASAEEAQTVAATRSDLISEGIAFNEYAQPTTGAVAVYRFFDATDGHHLFTSSMDEVASIQASRPGMVNEGVAFYAPQYASA